jgi:hypothetical protein
LEKVVTSPNNDPTSRPGESDVEQPDVLSQDTRFGEDAEVGQAPQPGGFAESELKYGQTDAGREEYGQTGDYSSQSTSTVDTAKGEATNVKDTAAGAASDVAQTAKSEASNVAGEAKQQAKNLIGQTQSELRGQVSNQQSAIAQKLNGWASELGSMASQGEESGQMNDLAHEASRRVGAVSHWLDNHEPADVLDEVKRFARRRPVAFLAIAAAAGVVAGRVTRGAVAANTSVDSDNGGSPARAYDSDVYGSGYQSATPGGTAYGARGYDDGGYGTRYREDVGATSYSVAPDTATGTSYPDVTPAGEEPSYPPPVGGDVRR